MIEPNLSALLDALPPSGERGVPFAMLYAYFHECMPPTFQPDAEAPSHSASDHIAQRPWTERYLANLTATRMSQSYDRDGNLITLD